MGVAVDALPACCRFLVPYIDFPAFRVCEKEREGVRLEVRGKERSGREREIEREKEREHE